MRWRILAAFAVGVGAALALALLPTRSLAFGYTCGPVNQSGVATCSGPVDQTLDPCPPPGSTQQSYVDVFIPADALTGAEGPTDDAPSTVECGKGLVGVKQTSLDNATPLPGETVPVGKRIYRVTYAFDNKGADPGNETPTVHFTVTIKKPKTTERQPTTGTTPTTTSGNGTTPGGGAGEGKKEKGKNKKGKPCKCKTIVVKLDGTLIDKTRLPPDQQDFGVGFKWTMSCTKGTGGCKGEVKFKPPEILAGSLPPQPQLKLNLKRASFLCKGKCGKGVSGKFEVKMLSRAQLNQMFGRTLAYTVVTVCNGVKKTHHVKVRVESSGQLHALP